MVFKLRFLEPKKPPLHHTVATMLATAEGRGAAQWAEFWSTDPPQQQKLHFPLFYVLELCVGLIHVKKKSSESLNS